MRLYAAKYSARRPAFENQPIRADAMPREAVGVAWFTSSARLMGLQQQARVRQRVQDADHSATTSSLILTSLPKQPNVTPP